MSKELVNKVLDCVEVKVNLQKLGEIVIDDVIEKALDKVVADTKNTFDDSGKAMLWPLIEKEAKELLAEKAAQLEAAIKKKIDDLRA